MSLALVIARFKTGTYSVSRPGADSYTDGIRTAGAPTVFTADASVQPLTGRDVKALPEGRRAEDARILWTSTELRRGDVVTIGTELFEVYNVKRHDVLQPAFYRVGVALQGVPG